MPESQPESLLSIYLGILRSASVEDGPFSHYEGEAATKTSEAFARMATAMADFVDAAQELPEVGYEGARDTLEDVVHMFPASKDPLEAILSALKNAIVAGPKDASGAYPMPAGASADVDAQVAQFADFLDKLPTAEDPNEKKES